MTKKNRKPAPTVTNGAACPHAPRALELAAVKRRLDDAGGPLGVCEACRPAPPTTGSGARDGPPSEGDQGPLPVWMCLKCGHQGCGRYAEGQHALAHHHSPPHAAETHCLALNMDTWSVWCYACDDEVSVSGRRVLAQTVAMVRKLSTERQPHPTHTGSVEGGAEGEERREASPPAVRGLSNLGNTCFFNAVMQNLAQTRRLLAALGETGSGGVMSVHPPGLGALSLTLGAAGPLTSALLHVLGAMRAGRRGALNPCGLFGELCRRCPRFKGFQQQDSQELLRYLLDGVKAEDVTRIKCAILEALDKPSSKTADEETRRIVKGYGLHAVRLNPVDRVFGGELINIITCDECGTIVRVTEPFLDLSLPVTDDTGSRSAGTGGRGAGEEVREEVVGSRRRGGPPSPPPSHSKYQDKKGKKQARQQAKSLRRQQKHQRRQLPAGGDARGGDRDSPTSDTATSATAHGDNAHDGDGGADADAADGDDDGDGDDEDAAGLEARTLRTGEPRRLARTSPVRDQLRDLQIHDGDGGDDGGDGGKEHHGDKVDNGSRETGTTVEEGRDAGASGETASPEDVNIEVDEEVDAEQEEEEAAAGRGHAGRCTGDPLSFGSDEETHVEAAEGGPVWTLAEPPAVPSDPPSLLGCLLRFTAPERLSGSNRLLCEHCSLTAGRRERAYTEGRKRILVASLPPVLTLHLKRFQQAGVGLRKVNRRVEFPHTLNMAPFCISTCQPVAGRASARERHEAYTLYGVVEHSGTMRGGHYTAYVKQRLADPLPRACRHGAQPDAGRERVDGDDDSLQEAEEEEAGGAAWFHVSDSQVRPASLAQVLASQAYVLFYERVGA